MLHLPDDILVLILVRPLLDEHWSWMMTHVRNNDNPYIVLKHVPLEMLAETAQALLRLAGVCQRFRALALDNYVWREMDARLRTIEEWYLGHNLGEKCALPVRRFRFQYLRTMWRLGAIQLQTEPWFLADQRTLQCMVSDWEDTYLHARNLMSEDDVQDAILSSHGVGLFELPRLISLIERRREHLRRSRCTMAWKDAWHLANQA